MAAQRVDHAAIGLEREPERIENFETVRVAKDGRRIDVSLSISPIRDGAGEIVGAAKVARDITERKRTEEHQAMLIAELDHRVKNTLALVAALCSQTLRETPSPEAFEVAFQGRVHALARAHRQLSAAQWRGSDLASLLQSILAPHMHSDGRNLIVDGPDVLLTPKATLTFALVFHELATNAAKYGAFSESARGRVHVQWQIAGDGQRPQLRLHWTEQDGSAVRQPEKTGFGTKLMERSIQHEIGGCVQCRFEPEGFDCVIEVPWEHEVGELVSHAVSAP